MSALAGFLGALLAVAAGLAAYLVSPNQRLLTRPAPAVPGLAGAGGAFVAAVLLLRQPLGPAAAVYAALTFLMITLTALPFVGLLRRRGRREEG